MEIKQASPRHCASYNLSKRITLVGDDDDMGLMELIKDEVQRIMTNAQTIWVDRQNNETSRFHYNFDCVKLRIGLYEINIC